MAKGLLPTPKRALLGVTLCAAIAAPLLTPTPANAWWRGGWGGGYGWRGGWGWRGGFYVAPRPVIVAPAYYYPPVVYAPRPAYAPAPYPTARWIPPHWNAQRYYVPGHWQ